MKKLIDYIGHLPLTQGQGAGGKFPVFPWERRFLTGAFRPAVQEAALSVGRGNGKSSLCAAVGVACLDGPLVRSRAEVVVCASSFEQGRIIFEHVLAMLPDATDRRRWRVWDSANVAQIKNLDNGVTLKCIGSDPRRSHGLAPVLVLADEPAQWLHTTADRMIAALRTALGKIEGSRLIALGTRPDSEAHWFQKMLDGEADYIDNYSAPADAPPFQKRTWVKANPSLRYMPWLEKTIRKEAGKAKRDSDQLAAFKALRLNLGTADTLQSLLIDADEWKRIEVDKADLADRYALGIDLGGTAAMSAAAGFWPDTGRLEAVACFPEIPSLAERGLADGVGNLYVKMAEAGDLIQAGRRVSSIEELLTECLERWGTPGVIVCDRWREGELREKLEKIDFPITSLEVRGQGFKDGGEDVRIFRKACAAGNVRPERSLLLRAAMSEARVVGDPAGNEKLSKLTQGGRRARARDDAAAAAILAVAAGMRRSRSTRSATPVRAAVI